MSEAKILGLPEPIGKGIRITERKEIEGIALARYFPRRLKRLHFFDEFSRDLFQFKKFYDVALIEKFAKALAEVIRNTGKSFDVCTFPPASRSRLYYPCEHLARATATELDLDLLACLEWQGKSGSQKSRRGRRRLIRLSEDMICTADVSNFDILCVDDILTSGLTMMQATAALKQAGAGSVFGGVLGWTISEDILGFQSVKFKRSF